MTRCLLCFSARRLPFRAGVLFYVAFYKQDLARLRALLRSLLITKQITGNLIEG